MWIVCLQADISHELSWLISYEKKIYKYQRSNGPKPLTWVLFFEMNLKIIIEDCPIDC